MTREIKELLTLHFINDGVRTTFIILLPFIAKDLSLTLAQAGFLGSSQSLVAGLLALPAGFIMGRTRGFQLILNLFFIYSLGAIGIALSMNPLILMAMFYLGAIGFGMFHTVGFALTAKFSSHQDIGRNMGDFTSIGEIGRVALPPLAVFTTSLIGWRLTIGVIGVSGLLLFFLFKFTFTAKDPKIIDQDSSLRQHHLDFLKDILLLFKRKDAALIVLTAIFDSLASSPIYVYLPFLLLAKGLKPQELGVIMAGFFVGSLAGKTILGRSVDKIGNKMVFIFSELSMAFVLILTVLSFHFVWLLACAFCLGIFTKGTSPVVNTMFSELTHKDHYHKVYALSELVICIAAAFSIVSFGLVADKTNIGIVFYLTAVLAVLAVIPMIIVTRKTEKRTNGVVHS